jgi:hypothetical protein
MNPDQVNQVIASTNRIWMMHLPAGILDNDQAEPVVCTMPIDDTVLERSDYCYHDSGSNRHVFFSEDVFDQYQEIVPVQIHAFSKGLTIAATGAGSVNLEGCYKGKSAIFTLTNCLHVPGAHANLVSQFRLDKFGVSTIFEDGAVTLYKDGVLCIDGKLHNEMYRLNLRPVKAKGNRKSMVMRTKISGNVPDFCIA